MKQHLRFLSSGIVVLVTVGCSQSARDVPQDFASAMTGGVFAKVYLVGAVPKVPRGGSVNTQACLLDDKGNQVPSWPDYTEITADPTSLPAGLSMTAVEMPGGQACTTVTFKATAAIGSPMGPVSVSGIRLYAHTYLRVPPTPILIYSTGGLADVSVVPGSANLTIELKGLPLGTKLAKALTLTGPSGFSAPVTASKTFELAEGTYTISAPQNPSRTEDPIVSMVLDVPTPGTAQTAVLSAGEMKTLSITYFPRNGSGRLWFATSNSSGPTVDSGLVAYTSSQLANATSSVNTVTPDISIINPFGNPSVAGFTFTPNGTLLASFPDRDLAAFYSKIGRYQVSQLIPGTFVGLAPSSYINSAYNTMDYAISMLVDRDGNLWMASEYPNGIVIRIPPANQNPMNGLFQDLMITNVKPRSLAMDQNGDIYFSNYGDLSIYRVPARFPSGIYDISTGVPGINSYRFLNPTSLQTPGGFVFDKDNNMWVSDGNRQRVVRVPNTKVAALRFGSNKTDDMTNYVTIAGPNTTISRFMAAQLAIDNSGNLWMVNNHPAAADKTELLAFDTSILTPGDNNVAPMKRITHRDIDVSFGDIRFNPPACNLPSQENPSC